MGTYVTRTISGNRYLYFQKYEIDPVTGKKKRKPKREYVGRAGGFGAGRLFAGAVAFVIRAMKGELPSHDFQKLIHAKQKRDLYHMRVRWRAEWTVKQRENP